MRILVTGGAGFIGAHTVRLATLGNHDVHVLDVATPSTGTHHKTDITTQQAQDEAISVDPEHIIHLAADVDAQASIMKSERNFETNVNGTIRMLEVARMCDATFTLASSAAVYGDTMELPIKESTPTKPTSPYGASKVSAEIFVNQYAKTYGIKTLILRYANVFGPGQWSMDAVIPSFINNAMANEPITIFGDGKQTRDFVFVEDVARANMLFVDKLITGCYNVGSGEEITIVKLAQMIKDSTKSTSLIENKDARMGDITRSVLDSSCLWDFMPSQREPFEARIVQTCAWYKENRKNRENPIHMSTQLQATAEDVGAIQPLYRRLIQKFRALR